MNDYERSAPNTYDAHHKARLVMRVLDEKTERYTVTFDRAGEQHDGPLPVTIVCHGQRELLQFAIALTDYSRAAHEVGASCELLHEPSGETSLLMPDRFSSRVRVTREQATELARSARELCAQSVMRPVEAVDRARAPTQLVAGALVRTLAEEQALTERLQTILRNAGRQGQRRLFAHAFGFAHLSPPARAVSGAFARLALVLLDGDVQLEAHVAHVLTPLLQAKDALVRAMLHPDERALKSYAAMLATLSEPEQVEPPALDARTATRTFAHALNAITEDTKLVMRRDAWAPEFFVKCRGVASVTPGYAPRRYDMCKHVPTGAGLPPREQVEIEHWSPSRVANEMTALDWRVTHANALPVVAQ